MPSSVTPAPSDRRRIGRSSVEVSALSIGTAPLGNLYAAVPDTAAAETIDAGLREGLRYVDTAPLYGFGLAERRTGTALRAKPRKSFTLSTKVGRLIRHNPDAPASLFDVGSDAEAVFDFSAGGIERSLEASVDRLGIDRVDVVYIHDPDDHVEEALRTSYPALHDLRAQGVIGAIGVGMNHPHVPTTFVRETDIDVVLLAGRYTLLDSSALDELLPACQQRGVSLVAAAAFNTGILLDPRPGARFDYQPASPELLARAQRIAAVCRAYDVPLGAAALQYPLGHPAVVSVLAGMRSAVEVRTDVAWMQHPIPAALWSDLAELGIMRGPR